MATIAPDTYVLKGNGHLVIVKDPNAILDYPFNWTDYLEDVTDTIVSATFIVDPTLTITNTSFDTQTATVRLSGGVAPASPAVNELRVTCRITTSEGRVDDRSIYLKIAER